MHSISHKSGFQKIQSFLILGIKNKNTLKKNSCCKCNTDIEKYRYCKIKPTIDNMFNERIQYVGWTSTMQSFWIILVYKDTKKGE